MKFIIAPLVFVLAAVAAWFFLFAPRGAGPVACTQEAKLCSDGSAVGRTGPNCEFAACPDTGNNSGNGGGGGNVQTSGIVKGKGSIGPLCPVERLGVTCGPADIYSSRKIVMTPMGGGQSVNPPFYIKLSADGTFEDRIPESSYEVTLTNCQFLGCRHALPKTVMVDANKTLILTIDIDTGIR